MTGMDDLVTWLRAQLDDDAAAPYTNRNGMCDANGVHIEAEQWLAEVDAKRRILELHAENVHRECQLCGEREGGDWPCRTVRLLTLALADRSGYRDEWRVADDHA
jgi:Family of unknown function (DUF6221)